MEYEVKTEQFEGPLDLLLHLIKKDNIDIFEISISKITEQYLNYINLMKEKNLDIKSEYLVLAAELIELKSKLLLPNKSEEIEEEIEEEKGNLINRILEYEKYKEISKNFKQLESIRKTVHTRISKEIFKYKNDQINNLDFDLNDLMLAFKNFLRNKELEKPLKTKIEKKEYSIEKRCLEIKVRLKKQKCINFDELFEIKTKDFVVVTFLAMLSLVKKKEIAIEQENNFNKIIIKRREILWKQL